MQNKSGYSVADSLPAAFKGGAIELIKSGYSCITYRLEDAKGRVFIVRQGNLAKDSGSSLEKEVVVLQFLAVQGISFVPQILHWDKGADISIETYVGLRDVAPLDFDAAMIDLFADQLHAIHALPIGGLLGLADEPGVKLQFSEAELLDLYGFSRLELARKGCPDRALLDWLESRLEQNMRSTTLRASGKPHLMWGDIGNNLRTDGKRLFFIDWEHCRVGSGSELAYVYNHTHVPKPLFDRLVQRYAQLSGITEAQLREEMATDERVTRINDTIWAAMKWSQATTDIEKEKYKKLAYARRKQADLHVHTTD